jgi:hypothetical protein
MMVAETILVLAVWLAFIWICDPDGFREAARRKERRAHNPSPN